MQAFFFAIKGDKEQRMLRRMLRKVARQLQHGSYTRGIVVGTVENLAVTHPQMIVMRCYGDGWQVGLFARQAAQHIGRIADGWDLSLTLPKEPAELDMLLHFVFVQITLYPSRLQANLLVVLQQPVPGG